VSALFEEPAELLPFFPIVHAIDTTAFGTDEMTFSAVPLSATGAAPGLFVPVEVDVNEFTNLGSSPAAVTQYAAFALDHLPFDGSLPLLFQVGPLLFYLGNFPIDLG